MPAEYVPPPLPHLFPQKPSVCLQIDLQANGLLLPMFQWIQSTDVYQNNLLEFALKGSLHSRRVSPIHMPCQIPICVLQGTLQANGLPQFANIHPAGNAPPSPPPMFPSFVLKALSHSRVCLQGTLQANGLPQGIDALIPLFFNGVDESASSLFADNLEMTNFSVPDSLTEYDDYETWSGTTVWQTINGHVWWVVLLIVFLRVWSAL